MTRNKTAFVFPGQGSQFVGMGKEIYDNFPVARQVFEEVDSVVEKKLTQIMFEGPEDVLKQTENTQPALMAVSIAIMRVIEAETGRKLVDFCDFVAGHSLGEYSALCAAGALSLTDTTKLLKIRGNAMANCGGDGAMAAVLGADKEKIEEVIATGLRCQVANDNSTGQIVISGYSDAIDEFIAKSKEFGIKKVIKLPVSGAFHSNLMKPAQEVMDGALRGIDIKIPSVNLIANVTANLTQNPHEIRQNLVSQITSQVRWRESILLLESKGVERVFEIGAGSVLCGLFGKTAASITTSSIQNLESLGNFIKDNAK